MEVSDPYKVLGVLRTAKQNEIQAAFKMLTRKFHPDVSKDPEAEVKFKGISAAYALIGHPEDRFKYDHNITGRNFRAEQPSETAPNVKSARKEKSTFAKNQIADLLDTYFILNEKAFGAVESFMHLFRSRYFNLLENLILTYHDRDSDVLGYVASPKDLKFLIFEGGPRARLQVDNETAMRISLEHLDFDANVLWDSIEKIVKQLEPCSAQVRNFDFDLLTESQKSKYLKHPWIGTVDNVKFQLKRELDQSAHVILCDLYNKYETKCSFGSAIAPAVDSCLLKMKKIVEEIDGLIVESASEYYDECIERFNSIKGKIVRHRAVSSSLEGNDLAHKINLDTPETRYESIRALLFEKFEQLSDEKNTLNKIVGSDLLLRVSPIASGLSITKTEELNDFFLNSGVRIMIKDFENWEKGVFSSSPYGAEVFRKAINEACYGRANEAELFPSMSI